MSGGSTNTHHNLHSHRQHSKPRTPPTSGGGGAPSRRDSKSGGRVAGSMMVSPNYSDISDASDADMDTSQCDVIASAAAATDASSRAAAREAAESAEERLFCNERLPSPSPTPGTTRDGHEGAASPLTTSAQRLGNDVSIRAHAQEKQLGPQQQQQQQTLPLHAVNPYPIMYPYFQFMPGQQLGGQPGALGPPPHPQAINAPPAPYFMYPGFPVMPNHAGLAQGLAPGQPYVAVSGAPQPGQAHNPTLQVPKSKAS